MENNLIKIAEKAKEITSELLHSGYSGDMLEEIVIDKISEELLYSMNIDSSNIDNRKMLMNMFMLGKVFNK